MKAFALPAVLVALALPGAAAASVAVRVDRAQISTTLGRTVVFRSTIANRSGGPLRAAIAHLNVVSLRPGVYVDPEDWSSNRTRYLGTIPAGGSRTVVWRVQAVNAGDFGLYVAALSGTRPAPAASPAVRLAVADRRTLSSGGILPLAVGVPALLGVLALAVRRWPARR